MRKKGTAKRRPSEASFTLIETMIALGMMATVIAQITGVQSQAIDFGQYSRSVTRAVYLAKRVMSQVEYHWQNKDFKEIKAAEEGAKFEEIEDYEDLKEYTYSLTIDDWKFPILDFLTGGGGGSEEGEGDEGGEASGGGGVGDIAKQVLGDELLKIAKVEVFWPEGANRNSETVTMLLTNQRKVDEEIAKLIQLTSRAGGTRPAATGSTGATGATGASGSEESSDSDN